MKYLLDASSLYRLAEANKLHIIEDSATLDLARYELGNAVLKDLTMLKRIGETDAYKLITFLYQILDSVKQLKVSEGHGVLKMASALKLSFYDAAYVYCAKSSNLTFITEDEKLRKKIKEYIKTSNVKELPEV